MDAILKQQWLEALRSGRYRHTIGSLKETDKDGNVCHCTLGVLADIHPDIELVRRNHEGESEFYEAVGGKSFPEGMRQDYDTFNFLLGGPEVVREVWQSNDGFEKKVVETSYTEAADWIEKHL